MLDVNRVLKFFYIVKHRIAPFINNTTFYDKAKILFRSKTGRAYALPWFIYSSSALCFNSSIIL